MTVRRLNNGVLTAESDYRYYLLLFIGGAGEVYDINVGELERSVGKMDDIKRGVDFLNDYWN